VTTPFSPPATSRAALPSTVVVVDTDAFSRMFVQRSRSAEPASTALRRRLQGKIVVIATQTRAELKAWPLLKSWGSSRRARLDVLLAGTSTVPVTDDVIEAYVALTVQCRAAGHALAGKDHVADRWVAASAVALDRPLLALDRIYENAPALTLLP
jgi:predicted nucleic acid-binding protein